MIKVVKRLTNAFEISIEKEGELGSLLIRDKKTDRCDRILFESKEDFCTWVAGLAKDLDMEYKVTIHY